MNKAAIIGTGVMGTGMGKVLLDQGFEVSCYNRTEKNAGDLVSAGSVYYNTPAKAAQSAEVVISMMWSKEALDSVMLGADGLLPNALEGQLFIDMSTQLPETGVWLAEKFGDKKALFLDAPVHGSKSEANSGELWIMVGGGKMAMPRQRQSSTFSERHTIIWGKAAAGMPQSCAGTIWSQPLWRLCANLWCLQPKPDLIRKRC